MTDSQDIVTVLVVDDEVFVAFEMADILAELGFEVVGPALTADDAERLATDTKLDAAFLDVNLGAGSTSEPVAKVLRARGIPFIFITAYSADQITFRTSDERVLQKPVTSRKVIEALKAALPDLATEDLDSKLT